MRQVWIPRHGPPEVLEVREAPLPEPGQGEVRIRVAAVGVNFADVVGRLGRNLDAPRPPYVPGYEVAGVVEAVGEGVTSTAVGARVIALLRGGGYSEAVVAPVAQILPLPDSLSWEQSAAFPVAYLTAYCALVAQARIRPKERVLIQAAAGGLGLAAAQIARQFEATIYGTASAAKHDALRAQGVHPIDYRRRDFETEVRALTGGAGVDIALDSIGGRSWLKSYRALAPLGRLVIVGATALTPGPRRSVWALLRFAVATPWLTFNPVRLTSDNRGVLGVNMAHLWDERNALRAWADQLLAWVGEGKIVPVVDRAFPLAEVAAAHRYLHERRNIGKVVLKP